MQALDTNIGILVALPHNFEGDSFELKPRRRPINWAVTGIRRGEIGVRQDSADEIDKSAIVASDFRRDGLPQPAESLFFKDDVHGSKTVLPMHRIGEADEH